MQKRVLQSRKEFSNMSLDGKFVSEFIIKASAEKVYKFFKDQASNLSNISPNIIQKVEVNEGNWDTHGSTKIWNYTIGMYISDHKYDHP